MNSFLLNNDLIFAITNRFGGISKGCFSTLNLAYHLGDKEEFVRCNRQRVLKKMGIDDRILVYMNQVHGNDVVLVDELIIEKQQKEIEVRADALISSSLRVALLVVVADCNPILLYDKRKRVFSVVHAGRKGVELKILSKVLELFEQKFKSNIQDIYGIIGPGIRSCCYEVKQDVVDIFAYEQSLSQAIVKDNNRYFLDLLKPLCQEWHNKGANKEHLCIDFTCTACCAEYFSFRREKVCGRFGLIAARKH